jgi:hypothetical protein
MRFLRELVSVSAIASVSLILGGCGGSSPATQTITFSAPSSQLVVGGTATLSGTATSNLAVTYASTSASICTVSGSTVTAVAIGTCSVTASQAGNSSFDAASPVTVTFSIGGDSQTITFGTVPALTVGATETLAATASSGLTVSFTASPSAVCTVSDTTLTGVGAGTCTVTASQAGNSTFAAAASVPQTLSIGSPAVTFSSGFSNISMTTLDGGAVISYGGSDQDGWNCSGGPTWCGSGSGGTPAADSYAFAYYQTPVPITGGEYVGMSIFAPGVTVLSTTANTSGVSLSGQTSISFTFNTNPEWVTATAPGMPNVWIELTMGNLYNPTPTSTCNVQMQTVFAATGGATGTPYTIPLANFNVTQNCGDSTVTAATALAQPISRIDFQGDGGVAAVTINGITSNSNLTTPNTAAPPVYPTTVALGGPITFE